ncbi:hypothetical protein PAGL106935_20645 [Paenibacillus glucanolyticus]
MDWRRDTANNFYTPFIHFIIIRFVKLTSDATLPVRRMDANK